MAAFAAIVYTYIFRIRLEKYREGEGEGEYRDNTRKWRSNGFNGEIWKYTQNDDEKAGTSGTIRNN